MSLRRRLVAGCCLVALVLATSVVVLVVSQRAYMTRQVDAQLDSAASFADEIAILVDSPELYAAVRGSLAVTTSIELTGVTFGYLAPDGGVVPFGDQPAGLEPPAFESIDVSALPERTVKITVNSASGGRSFRAIVMPTTLGGRAVVALPLDDVDRTVDRLLVTSLITALLVLAVFASIAWWVERLGLRPIQRMTENADAIAAGARDVRVSIVDDTTEAGRLGRAFNQMLDQRDAAEARLRQFVADASHELRTPLTSIRGYVDLAADGDVAPGQTIEMLGRLRKETRRMSDLVEDLLLLANLDTGRPLRDDPVDAVRLVRDAADDARAIQPDRIVTVELIATDALVNGDMTRLEQVVSGLVNNALVHTPVTAAIHLSVRADARDVVVTVSDDGPGMEPELAARVFDRFARGDASRSRYAAGTGLGLSIAKSIVEAHGGRLELRTAPGAGAEFRIILDRVCPAR